MTSSQPGTVYWITGLSGAGKSTLSAKLKDHLRSAHHSVMLLDGDSLRWVYGDQFGHTRDERLRCALQNARLCKLLSDQGHDVICATISLFHECHQWNRSNFNHYIEILLECSVETLKKRDLKGVYSQQANRAGLDFQVEWPTQPDIRLNCEDSSPDKVYNSLIEKLEARAPLQRETA